MRATTSSSQGLRSTDYVDQFLAPGALDRVAGEIGSRLGSTTTCRSWTPTAAVATVTCSNGSSSGIVVPGTGMHLNNMMGEEDLNPGGFHEHPPGDARAQHDGPDRGAARRPARGRPGLGGLQPDPVGHRPDHRRGGGRGLAAQAAVDSPRVHVEGPLVDAEPGVDEAALEALAARDWQVKRWHERNLYFGGVQAVVRDADGR